MPTILIIEDDLTFGLMIQKWLNRKGFAANKASSLREARQQLEKTTPDLILSDLRLPDGDGISLLSQLRDEGLTTPFIVMTSYAEVENAVLVMKAGATDYIAKPFPPDLLLEKISEALHSSRLSAVNKVADATSQRQTPSAADKTATEQNTEASTPIYIEGESEASKQLYRYVDLV